MVRPRPIYGILVDWLENEYQNNVLAGVEETARKYGANLLCFAGGVLGAAGAHGSVRNFLYELAGAHTVDGLVVMGGTMGNLVGPDELARYCDRFRPLPMCSIGSELAGIPSVLVDNARGMRALLDHLIQVHGYRRLAFIRGPQASAEAASRYEAYSRTLDEYGLAVDPDLVVSGDFEAASGAAAVRELVDNRRVEFDAVVAASDAMALGAIDALQSRGMRVPIDVAVVGFDDVESARFATAPLTTVRQPLREQGIHALQAVIAQRRGEEVDARRVLRTHLVVRQSCGCPATMTLPAANYQALRPTASLEQTLRQHRRPIVADMGQAIRSLSGSLETVWGERLLDSLAADLEHAESAVFLTTLEEILNMVATLGGAVSPWHAAIDVLRHHARGCAGSDPESWVRAEEIWHEARTLISMIAERAQAQQRLAADRSSRTLRSLAELLATSLDVAAIPELLKQHLPQLRIKSFYLALFDGRPEAALSHLVGAYDASGRLPTFSSEPFAWPELLPRGSLPTDRRYTYIIEPLHFEQDSLGYVLLEMGPSDGVIYETIRDHIGSAVRGAILSHRLSEEGARRQVLEQQREELEHEIGARIQTAALPREINVEGLEIAAGMIPARSPGGDYYDVLPVEDGCWLGIGDVAGHGLATGVVAIMLRSIVAALVARSPRAAPSELLRSANSVLFEAVRRRLHEELHASMTLLHIDRGGRMIMAGAHEEIVVCRGRDGKCFSLPTPGTWLGAVRDVSRSMIDTQCQLEQGDLLVLYTDGVPEARDSNDEPFGTRRLWSEIEHARSASVDRVRDRLFEAIRGWSEPAADDVSLIVARYLGQSYDNRLRR